MKGRYVLAPEAARELVRIWRHIDNNASLELADRVEAVIRDKMAYLAGTWRRPLAKRPDR